MRGQGSKKEQGAAPVWTSILHEEVSLSSPLKSSVATKISVFVRAGPFQGYQHQRARIQMCQAELGLPNGQGAKRNAGAGLTRIVLVAAGISPEGLYARCMGRNCGMKQPRAKGWGSGRNEFEFRLLPGRTGSGRRAARRTIRTPAGPPLPLHDVRPASGTGMA
ncbi:hypothetical protein H8959_019053 [Pygathrix nigripes]